MKVLMLSPERVGGGCRFYRMDEPARVVSEQFPDVDVRVTTSLEVEAEKNKATGIITVHEVKEDIDVLVIQRPLLQQNYSLLQQAKKQGIAVVVEVDDDLTTVHPANAAYSRVNPKNSPRENWEWFQKSVKSADLLTCTTLELTRFNKSHALIPNFVPERFLKIDRTTERTGKTVGWSGTVQNHPFDLDVTNGQVGKVVKEAGGSFFVVGDGTGVQRALKLPPSVPFSKSGWVPLEEYHQTIADNIDIGIVPLQRSTFNAGKSNLKGLEMASQGIPFVATSTEPYQRLAEMGVGKLADDHNGFRYALRGWLKDPDRAREDGQRYKQIVADKLTYEQHAERWVRAWERAIKVRKENS